MGGDKMTKAEIDDIFGEFEIDEDYMIKTKEVVGLFVAVKEEEKKVEEAPPPVEEAPAEEEAGDDSKKRRRRRRRPPSKCKCSINIPISIFFINYVSLVLQMSCKMINNRKQ